MVTKQILVSLIDVDVDTQARVGVSDETIKEYVAVLVECQQKKEAPPFPPVELFYDGSNYFIGDGWHRVLAWLETTISCIPARVHNGGKREAMLHAIGANKGLRRTNEDKRRAVSLLLEDEEWSKWTTRQIADHCGVSHMLVVNMRKELETVSRVAASPISNDATSESAETSGEATTEETPAAETESAESGPEEPAEAKPKIINLTPLAEPYKRICGELSKAKKELTTLAANATVGAHLSVKVARVTASLDEAKTVLRALLPKAVCGKCGGVEGGCQHCARTGFWTAFQVENQKRA